MRSRLTRQVAMAVSMLLAAAVDVQAGDPDGVSQALSSLVANWPEASLSIDVAGTGDGQLVLDRPLNVEYEAALPGYLTYLRVSSHGDILAHAEPGTTPQMSGTLHYTAQAPLGNEQLLVLFSSAPLTSLLGGGATRAVGADRGSATDLIHQLAQLQASGTHIAVRRYHYEVAAQPGGTEYTTRGIVFNVMDSTPGGGSPAREQPRCTGISAPAHTAPRNVFPAHVEFEFDSDRLTPQGKLDIDEFGAALGGQLKTSKVVLQGNTDAVGTDDYNQSLSQRRANRVQEYLQQSFSIEAARISAVGLGKSNPIAPNDSDAGRACNRRVDFVISR